MVEYDKISEQEWTAYPASSPKASTEWDIVLDELELGKVLSIPYTDDKDRRSKRISLARRAAGRGFRTEVRFSATDMAIRKAKASELRPKQTRRRKDATESE